MSSLPIIDKWYDFLRWLLDTSNKFPKKIRFTITSRIDNLALSILENLIQARYAQAKTKKSILQQMNIDLEKMRFLLRLCYDNRYMAKKSYEYACSQLQSIGKQIGGWLKAVQS